MAGSFPNLSSGVTTKYPVSRSNGFSTGITRFTDFTEQRWVQRPGLHEFVLQFTRLNATDLATIRTFFNSQKGAFDATWSLAFDGTTYNYMAFSQDDFSPQETSQGLWNLTLRCRQVRKN